MAECESCHAPLAGARSCARCGHPLVQGEAASLLGEAADLVAVGQPDLALRKTQQAAKLSPEAWLPRLRLAVMFDRKVARGETSLRPLADREMSEALRIAPEEMEIHSVIIAQRIRSGGFAAVRAEYEARRGKLAVADECLKIIDALESAGGAARKVLETEGASPYKERMFLIAALLTGAGVIGLVVGMAIKFMQKGPYSLLASVDFYLSLVLFAATGILAMEFLRAKGILKK